MIKNYIHIYTILVYLNLGDKADLKVVCSNFNLSSANLIPSI